MICKRAWSDVQLAIEKQVSQLSRLGMSRALQCKPSILSDATIRRIRSGRQLIFYSSRIAMAFFPVGGAKEINKLEKMI